MRAGKSFIDEFVDSNPAGVVAFVDGEACRVLVGGPGSWRWERLELSPPEARGEDIPAEDLPRLGIPPYIPFLAEQAVTYARVTL